MENSLPNEIGKSPILIVSSGWSTCGVANHANAAFADLLGHIEFTATILIWEFILVCATIFLMVYIFDVFVLAGCLFFLLS